MNLLNSPSSSSSKLSSHSNLMDSNEKTNFLDDLTLQLQLQLSGVNKSEMFSCSKAAADYNNNFSQFLNTIQTVNSSQHQHQQIIDSKNKNGKSKIISVHVFGVSSIHLVGS